MKKVPQTFSSMNPVIVKQERVSISAHNPTMRTALRVIALTAPFWALYVPGEFLGIFGFFLTPTILEANARVFWMLATSSMGVTGSALLLLNTMILNADKVVFPPLKAATVPIDHVLDVDWFWQAYEKQVYLRFIMRGGDHIDIHHSRFSPAKITILKNALAQWSPQCVFKIQAEELEDMITLRERFLRPGKFSLIEAAHTKKTSVIDVPYEPHRQMSEFFQSLGANEKYFWFCWVIVLMIPCLAKIPDIIWYAFVRMTGASMNYVDAPFELRSFDAFLAEMWSVLLRLMASAGGSYVGAAANPFVTCILIGIAALAVIGFGIFVCQLNRIRLKPAGIEVAFQWQGVVLYKKLYRWGDMREFSLDEYKHEVNPEDWQMQIKLANHHQLNLHLEAIKGSEAREAFLRSIRQMCPEAILDPALVKALMPTQKQSYTELWLQSLSAPPKRNRLAPLSPGQKLKDGRFMVARQLAVGGQE